mmetsp:Transcript_42987/g.130863  ORF Transcript_42987/g.130863 Transcript_42987/m.130863 type:complete len:259 (+) Transcript_42987:1201-1977(+)
MGHVGPRTRSQTRAHPRPDQRRPPSGIVHPGRIRNTHLPRSVRGHTSRRRERRRGHLRSHRSVGPYGNVGAPSSIGHGEGYQFVLRLYEGRSHRRHRTAQTIRGWIRRDRLFGRQSGLSLAGTRRRHAGISRAIVPPVRSVQGVRIIDADHGVVRRTWIPGGQCRRLAPQPQGRLQLQPSVQDLHEEDRRRQRFGRCRIVVEQVVGWWRRLRFFFSVSVSRGRFLGDSRGHGGGGGGTGRDGLTKRRTARGEAFFALD